MNLLLSTAALLAGPFVYALGRRQRLIRHALDALILTAIAWIVGVHIVPEALDIAGYTAVLALAVGMAFPWLLGRIFHLATSTTHVAILAIAALALILHAAIDGVALLPESGQSLSLAVIAHRIPVGMAIWWTFRPSIGTAASVVAFALIIAATAASYFFGSAFIDVIESRGLVLFQVFVAGSLVDLIVVKIRELFRPNQEQAAR